MINGLIKHRSLIIQMQGIDLSAILILCINIIIKRHLIFNTKNLAHQIQDHPNTIRFKDSQLNKISLLLDKH